MKIGILGSGTVAQHLGLGFIKSGHQVVLGTRDVSKLKDWLAQAGESASVGSFADVASTGEVIVIATKWDGNGTAEAITMAGKDNFKGKIVMDVTNPLVSPEPNQPPSLALGFPDSAGKKIQEWLPQSRVVKAFNIITARYMCYPKLEDGTPDMFIAGNDPTAKAFVQKVAAGWGWQVTDLGDINQAYLLEALAMIWIRYGALNNHWTHAFSLLKK